jgi:hypothetical protein
MAELRRYVIVNQAGEAVNETLWDGITPWHPGQGLEAVPADQWQAAPPAPRPDAAVLPLTEGGV